MGGARGAVAGGAVARGELGYSSTVAEPGMKFRELKLGSKRDCKGLIEI